MFNCIVARQTVRTFDLGNVPVASQSTFTITAAIESTFPGAVVKDFDRITMQVPEAVEIISTDTTQPSLDATGLPAEAKLSVFMSVNAKIIGAGGRGGKGGSGFGLTGQATAGANGGDGGVAIKVSCNYKLIDVINPGGSTTPVVFGGCGGGGGRSW